EAQAQMAGPGGRPDQRAPPDQVIWPKLTTVQSHQLKRWIQELPEVLAAHCSAMASKTGFGRCLGPLVEALELASNKLDTVTLQIVMYDAARRISYQGPDKPPLDLVGLTPGECLGRFLRKLVAILGDQQRLPDTPGYAALKDRAKF